jgi:hypothetical protein
MPEIITRKEARERGLKRFFTGLPCKHGHASERQAHNWACIECHRASDHKRLRNPRTRETVLESSRKKNAKRRERVEVREAEATYHRDWLQTPRGNALSRAQCAARRALKKGFTPRWACPKFAEQERQALAGLRKGQPRHIHLDHIYPLAGATYSGPDPEWRGVQISVGLEVSWNYQYLPEGRAGSDENDAGGIGDLCCRQSR